MPASSRRRVSMLSLVLALTSSLAAQQAGQEGTVILELLVDPTGVVADARVIRSIPLLDEAAVDAVRQWIYTPTYLNGVPVSIYYNVTVTFSLSR